MYVIFFSFCHPSEPAGTQIANCEHKHEAERDNANRRTISEVACLNCGIGKVYASGILAEIGSIQCFKNNDALAKYCGIVWKENKSGNFQAEDTPMNKAGNRYLRYYIIEAADSVVRHCPEYRDFYEKKFAEVRTHQHKRALALTSRKLIRMLFGLLAKSQLYSVEKSR